MNYKKSVCLAIDYIEENIHKELSLNEIAKAAAFSPFHFHRIFKAMTGENLACFIRRRRLEKAVFQLQLNPSSKITDIAMTFGFSTSQSFAKAFKKSYNMSSTEFKKNNPGIVKSKIGHAPLGLEWHSVLTKGREPFTIKSIYRRKVFYTRYFGEYGKESCTHAYNELQHSLPEGYVITPENTVSVYWDNPNITGGNSCRTDVCVDCDIELTGKSHFLTQYIFGGYYAVFSLKTSCNELPSAWDWAFLSLMKRGVSIDEKPCIEVYKRGTNLSEDILIVEVHIPVII